MIATRSRTLLYAGPAAALAAGCVALFAYLLARFQYGGLYGQDSYAYYYQALAIWQGITGETPTPSPFSANGLQHWPVGYHLHIIAGFLFGGEGPGGGRAITLFMSVAAPVLLYLVVGELLRGMPLRFRVISGLVAGAVLPLVATYTRMGLSLMSDVPDVFWGLLALFCCLRAWPVPGQEAQAGRPGKRLGWALVGGLALGLAVLLRYASAMLLAPLAIYMAVRWYQTRSWSVTEKARGPALLWLLPGLALAMLPQVAYLMAYDPGLSYSDWASGWRLSNVFSTTVTGPDGTATYAQSMIAFFLASPLWDSAAGFFSYFYLPALALGIAWLFVKRLWASLALLLSWWLLPSLFLSGTPYQAHRLALVFIPALACFIGTGAAVAVEAIVAALRGARDFRKVALAAGGALLLLSAANGALQGWFSVRQWTAIHASFQSSEQAVASLTRQAAGPDAQRVTPRVVSFGITAALYYYTGWPVLDFYNYGDNQIEHFLAAPGPHLVVLPEKSITTQWANTPSGERWQWMRSNYNMELAGTSGDYSVYTIEERHTSQAPAQNKGSEATR